MNILCTICAREGSRGIINKNLKKINNIPLIGYSINQAKKSKIFKKIIVSTDSNIISSISKKFGAEVFFKRPKKLSLDTAPKIPVVRHALKKTENYFGIKFDIIIDLDPTSPLRIVNDINNALNIFSKSNSNNLITVSKSKKNPYFNMIEVINKKVKIVKRYEKQLIRRQDAPKVFDMNASIYIWNREYLLKSDKLFTNNTSIYIMPEHRSVDIDTKFDLKIVRFLKNKNEKLFR